MPTDWHLQAAVCGAAGACGSWLYLQQIVMEINNVSADSEVPMKNAKMIRMQPFRALAMVAAGYRYVSSGKPCGFHAFADSHTEAGRSTTVMLTWCRQAMRPRLLIPITLFASFTVYRQLYEQRLGLIEAGALLAGFLSFKVRVACRHCGLEAHIGYTGGSTSHLQPSACHKVKLQIAPFI